MSENYILSEEFVLLVAFLFGIPLLISSAIVVPFFATRGLLRSHPWRVFYALGVSVVLSVPLGLGVLVLSPSLPRFLRLQDIFFAGQYWPVFPVSFIVVAAVSAIVARSVLRASRPDFNVEGQRE